MRRDQGRHHTHTTPPPPPLRGPWARRGGRALALGGLLFAALGAGCKKKPAGAEEGLSGPPVPPVEQSMQVVDVSPSTIAPGAPASVQVVGSGFTQGAALQVGPQRIPSVQLLNENVLSANLPPLAAGVYDVTVTLPTGERSTLTAGLRAVGTSASADVDRQRCGRVVVYFDTDQAGLSPTARARLDSVMDCYTGSSPTVHLTGHADERGTTDYNLALGQRRAEAVRDYLMQAGVPASRLTITSYGEEEPAARGHGESVWAKNRRVELIIP